MELGPGENLPSIDRNQPAPFLVLFKITWLPASFLEFVLEWFLPQEASPSIIAWVPGIPVHDEHERFRWILLVLVLAAMRGDVDEQDIIASVTRRPFLWGEIQDERYTYLPAFHAFVLDQLRNAVVCDLIGVAGLRLHLQFNYYAAKA